MAQIRNLVEQGRSYLPPGVNVTDEVIATANAEHYLLTPFISFKTSVEKNKNVIGGESSHITTRTGKDLSLVPFFFPDWTNKKGFRSDWLIVFALDSDGKIVGARTNHIVLGINGPESSGTLAAFICGEGIGRSLETITGKCMEEVALRYENEFGKPRPIIHTIEDDQIKRLTELEAIQDGSEVSDKIIEHFRSDRPRWVALWGHNGRTLTYNGQDHQIGIATPIQRRSNKISAETIAQKIH